MNEDQLGKFYISTLFILGHPDQVAEVFARLRIVVIRAEALLHRSCIEYIAISPNFNEIEESRQPPEYDIRITRNDREEIVDVEVILVDMARATT